MSADKDAERSDYGFTDKKICTHARFPVSSKLVCLFSAR